MNSLDFLSNGPVMLLTVGRDIVEERPGDIRLSRGNESMHDCTALMLRIIHVVHMLVEGGIFDRGFPIGNRMTNMSRAKRSFLRCQGRWGRSRIWDKPIP